jgi:hypothetical protein
MANDFLPPKVYTAEELAIMRKTTPRMIQRLAKDKELHGFKLGKGGDWRFPQAAVNDFILRNSGITVDQSRSPRLGRKKASPRTPSNSA